MNHQKDRVTTYDPKDGYFYELIAGDKGMSRWKLSGFKKKLAKPRIEKRMVLKLKPRAIIENQPAEEAKQKESVILKLNCHENYNNMTEELLENIALKWTLQSRQKKARNKLDKQKVFDQLFNGSDIVKLFHEEKVSEYEAFSQPSNQEDLTKIQAFCKELILNKMSQEAIKISSMAVDEALDEDDGGD